MHIDCIECEHRECFDCPVALEEEYKGYGIKFTVVGENHDEE